MRFEFGVTLVGEGDTQEEAWFDAIGKFYADPGNPYEEFKEFAEEDEEEDPADYGDDLEQELNFD